MNNEGQAAYVSSQTACALIEMEGMKAENQNCAINNMPPQYVQRDFLSLLDKYQLYHNSVVGFLNQI